MSLLGAPAGLADFTVGERVEFILPKAPSYGRAETWYCPATVEKITAKRLIIRVDRWPRRTRATTPRNVRKIAS